MPPEGQIPPSPPVEKGGDKRAGNRAARRVLRVMKLLGSGDLLEWRSIRQVAEALGLSRAETYGALEDLEAEGLAEKSEAGYRQSATGLSYYALQAQEAVARAVYQAGFRK